jgi:hypothetical protein
LLRASQGRASRAVLALGEIAMRMGELRLPQIRATIGLLHRKSLIHIPIHTSIQIPI